MSKRSRVGVLALAVVMVVAGAFAWRWWWDRPDDEVLVASGPPRSA